MSKIKFLIVFLTLSFMSFWAQGSTDIIHKSFTIANQNADPIEGKEAQSPNEGKEAKSPMEGRDAKVPTEGKDAKTPIEGKVPTSPKEGREAEYPSDSKQSSVSKQSGATPSENKSNQGQKLQYFNSINLSGMGDLYIKQSNKPSFTVEAEKKILPLVTVYVKDKTLYIDLKNSAEHSEAKIKYYLEVRDLKSIHSFTSSSIFINESFNSDELNLAMNSFGDATIFINVQKFSTNIEGGGKVVAKGVAQNQDIKIQGAGEFNGVKLAGKSGVVETSGPTMIKMNVSDTLAVKISGESAVSYCGKPVLTREISGKGIISPEPSKECI